MRQLLEGVAHWHKNKVIHRDLKPENIALSFKEDSLEVKLIDFGHAGYINPRFFKTKRLGTLHYMAPEVISNRYNEKCDLRSAGMILYCMLVGSLPLKSADRFEITK